jgi:hypothetical protein
MSKPFGQGGDRVAVCFESFPFVVGEVELFEHLVDAVLDSQEPTAGGVLGDVEAGSVRKPVGAGTWRRWSSTARSRRPQTPGPVDVLRQWGPCPTGWGP